MKRCCLCDKKDENLSSIRENCMYAKTYNYHNKCLRNVQSEPESYTNKIVDKTIVIGDTLKETKRLNKKRLDSLIKSM